MRSDKRTEQRRYDQRASELLDVEAATEDLAPTGADGIAPIYRAPYVYYEHCLERSLHPGQHVLELGAGTGMHTASLLRTGAHVVASDISEQSLRLLSRRLGAAAATVAADMESLPFRDASFDVVTCAGSLSYGDAERVDAELRRVLKPGGTFVCVDSLNHNPIYRFNRWLAYRRGRRTFDTLRRMPTEQRIAAISRAFREINVRYFGALTFLMPILAALMGHEAAARASDAIDRALGARRSAFKFVLLAQGRR